jgi:hypothetical protein
LIVEDTMKGLDERERGFEAEFMHKQELAFRITARRNRLFGLWAAARLGLAPGEAAETYAMSVIIAGFKASGDEDVIAKVRADLAGKELSLSEAALRAELGRAEVEARRHLLES